MSNNVITLDEYRQMQGVGGKKKASPEHDQQVALFAWASIMGNKQPELKMLMAIPNGASYGGGGGRWSIAKRMKDEGVKKGVPDIFLPVPMTYVNDGQVTDMKAGLWIEMKAGKNKPSEEQKWWMEQLQSFGYRVEVCYSTDEAIEVIENYLDTKLSGHK